MITKSKKTDDPAWPHDITIERAIIAALTQDPSACERVASVVSARDFFDAQLGKVFELLTESAASGKPLRSLAAIANITKRLDPVYGDTDYWRAFKSLGTQHNADWYADTIRRYSAARKLGVLGAELFDDVQAAAKQSLPPNSDELLAGLRARLDQIGSLSPVEIIPIAQAAEEAVQRAIEARAAEGRVAACTGLIGLDTSGAVMREESLTILAARPSCGKSAFALQVADHNANKGRAVLFVSLEMSRSEIALRLLARDSGVSMRQALDGKADDAAIRRMQDCAASLRSTRIGIITGGRSADTAGRGFDIDRLCATIRVERMRGRCDLAVIDYLQLIDPGRDGRTSQRHEQVGAMTRKLKSLALELKIPLLVLAQLNRAAEQQGKGGAAVQAQGRPKLSHLRESGSIEQDADNVWFLHNLAPDGEPMKEAEFIMAKARNGAKFFQRVYYDGPRFHFSEATPERRAEINHYAEMFAEHNSGASWHDS